MFSIGVIGKGIDGVLEIIGGALLLGFRPDQLNDMVRQLTLHELNEDPHDLVVHLLLELVHHISHDIKLFAAIYLLSHGMIKLGLVVALLRKKLWAFPTAIAVFVLFLGYQMYRYSQTGSMSMLVLSGLDVIVIGLTWLEYRRLSTEKI